MHLSLADIMEMESMYRRNLMNTLPGPRGVHLLGTKGHNGVENLGVFSSVVHIGANPPMLGFIMRPLTVPRQTYHHIQASGFFTLNTIQDDILEPAHQTSAKYKMEESEFEATGLTPFYGKHCQAPYVKESQIKIGLRLEEEHRIKSNDTLFLVGAVVEVIIDEAVVQASGHVDHKLTRAMAVSGLDSYYDLGRETRLPFPRP
ncbi:MAG: flavin reductase [Bacteroidota bacterium]